MAQFIDYFPAESEYTKYAELLEVLEKHKSDRNYDKIKSDLLYRQQLLQTKGEQFKECFAGITYKATHGDFQGCQFICEDGHIKAIVDYGYPQYLMTDSEDRKGLLQFGIWKTDILKEVENKADIIVERLKRAN